MLIGQSFSTLFSNFYYSICSCPFPFMVTLVITSYLYLATAFLISFLNTTFFVFAIVQHAHALIDILFIARHHAKKLNFGRLLPLHFLFKHSNELVLVDDVDAQFLCFF